MLYNEYRKKILLYTIADKLGMDIWSLVDFYTVSATVKVNENAMRFWAMQYGENVTIKSPKKLVEKMKKQLKDMIDRYK